MTLPDWGIGVGSTSEEKKTAFSDWSRYTVHVNQMGISPHTSNMLSGTQSKEKYVTQETDIR